jgi:hypothetical protein
MWRSWVLQLSPRAIFNRDKDLRGRSDIVIHSPRLMLRTMIPESIARSVIMPDVPEQGNFMGSALVNSCSVHQRPGYGTAVVCQKGWSRWH